MSGSNRNLIIIIVGILGVCVCGACVAVGGFLYISTSSVTSAAATVAAQLTSVPIGTPFVIPTIGLPTIPALPTTGPLPTIPGIPTSIRNSTAVATPPVLIPRTPTPGGIARATATTSISRNTPVAGGTTNVVFTDEFKTPCNLVDDDNDKRTFHCENNSYTMLNKTGTSRWVYYNDEYDDIVMEVDAHAVSGPDFIEYGVIFRVSSGGTDFYGFTLTRDGKYTLWRCEDPCQDSTDFIDLLSYTASPSVKSGTAVNHIKIVAQGDQIAVYVNDQWLNTVTDDSFSSGTFGLFLNNKDPNAKAAFEHLKVSEITGKLTLPKGVPTKTK